MPRLEVSFSRIGMWPRMDAGKRTYRRRELIGHGHGRLASDEGRVYGEKTRYRQPNQFVTITEYPQRGKQPLAMDPRPVAHPQADAAANREGDSRRPRAVHNPVDLRACRKVRSQRGIGRRFLQVARPEGISRPENPPGSRTGRAGVSIRPNQSPTRRLRHSPAGVSRTRQSLARNPAPELAPFRTSGCPSSCRGAAHRFVLHWPLVSGGLFTLRSAALHWHACIH